MNHSPLIRRKAWSPYFAGIIIGSLQIPVFIYMKSSLGTSSSFGAVACFFNSLWSSSSQSQTCLPTFKPLLQIGIVVGIFLGAYISSTLSNTRRSSISPVWPILLNSQSVFKRFMLAFLGGFFLLFGARIANGCTSGNGISGLALLSIGSYVVITSMFVSGMIVSFFYKKI
ncbi:MAG: lipocalin [Alphaproteobacteria bacterium]|nr:lipocalin [Alphaproteobacteria bacterium]